MDQATLTPEASVARPMRLRRDILVAVAGVLVLPTIVVVAANSYTAPSTVDYIRMAFSQVAAATIACSTLVGLAIVAYGSGRRSAATGWITMAAIAIALSTSSIIRVASWLEQAVS